MSEPVDTRKMRELAEFARQLNLPVNIDSREMLALLDELDAATAAFKEWQEKYDGARAEVVALSGRVEKLEAIRCSVHNGLSFARYLKDKAQFDAEGLGIVIGHFESILELLAADDAAAKERE